MPRNRYDVIIVGGGIAGLAAAQRLAKAKKKVCLVEARDRLGGRVYSLYRPEFPLPVEFGGEFFSVGDSEFLKRHTKRQKKAGYDGKQLCKFGGALIDCGDDWRTISKAITDFEGEDVTAGRFLRQLRKDKRLTERQLQLAEHYLEGYHAAPLGRLSMISVADQEAAQVQPGGEMSRLREGADAPFQLRDMKSVARIDLNSIAHTVYWSDEGVEVHCRTRSGQERAPVCGRRLIVALPLGVLRSRGRSEGSLRFEPALKETERALAELGVGQAVKLVARFESDFWKKALRGPDWLFAHSRDVAFPTWWNHPDRKQPWLTAWAGGPAASRLVGKHETLVARKAAESLAAIFDRKPAETASAMEAWFTHDWQVDPYARMAYSYLPAGAGAAQASLRKAVSNTIWFAGEHLAPIFVGTIHGAAVSGERAAESILNTD